MNAEETKQDKTNPKITFDLEGNPSPEDKIYGIIKIEPESAEKHLESLKLIVNKEALEYDININNRKISIAGFRDKEYTLQIKAKFDSIAGEIWSEDRKIYCDKYVHTISPIIRWEKDNNGVFILVVEWYHIGDKKAHEYLLYLNNQMVLYIPQRLIREKFKINIGNVSCTEDYLIEIAARLFNGKITSRSDPRRTRCSPEALKNVTEGIDILTVLNEDQPMIPPALSQENDDKIFDKGLNETSNKRFEELLAKLKADIEKRRTEKHVICHFDCRPHKQFPGVSHYFSTEHNTTVNLSVTNSSKLAKKITTNNGCHDDDDDDVILLN